MGTSWRADPKEELVGILMTQRMWTLPVLRMSVWISGPRFTGQLTTEEALLNVGSSEAALEKRLKFMANDLERLIVQRSTLLRVC